MVNLVRIGGTERKPVFVSADAVCGEKDREEHYWRDIAAGSVLPSSNQATDKKALDILLKTKK